MKKLIRFLGLGIITISLFMIFISAGNYKYKNCYQNKNEYHMEYKIEGQSTYDIREIKIEKSNSYEVEVETNKKPHSTIDVLVIISIGIIVSLGVVFLLYLFIFKKKGEKK